MSQAAAGPPRAFDARVTSVTQYCPARRNYPARISDDVRISSYKTKFLREAISLRDTRLRAAFMGRYRGVDGIRVHEDAHERQIRDTGGMKLDLAAARERTIPDVLPPEGARFDVLFCGINPGLYSAATGWHFARPGNRFWPALHASGFTPRLLTASEQDELTRYGLGITNIAPRATAQAAELTAAELREGGQRLKSLVAARR